MVNGKKNSAMKKRFVFSILAALAVCSCQVEEINEIAPESNQEVIREAKVFTAIIDDTTTPETRTSLDAEGNVLWKQGDQVSIFAGSTINEQYQVTDASDGKTAASLNKVSDPGFVAGTDIDHNIAFYPYVSIAAIAKSAGSYVISDITIPATQTYAEGSFGNGAFPMAAVTGSTGDMNLKFKNVLGGLKLQLKGTASIASISITGNNNEILCGAAEVTVANGSNPSINLTDASAKTVTLDCGAGVALNSETATPFIIALPPITMTGGFTVIVTDTEGKQMEIKTTKPQTISRSSLLKMPAVNYEWMASSSVPTPEAVDLGLSVKWASCNLGASKPTEYGGYYQWAGTEDVSDTSIKLDWSNCPYHTGSSYSSGWTKYNTKSSYGTVDNKTVLEAKDDVAHVKLGGKWRMPTDAEWTELINTSNCSWTWTTINGVNGYKVQSKKSGYTDNWIFLPAAGYRYGTGLGDVGSRGYFWSSSLGTYAPRSAWYVFFNSDDVFRNYLYRYYGRSVRPVSE